MMNDSKGATKMNKNKATHDGTCQICGHFQKLPNGLLAKHGYTKQWGFFSGTCTGSDGKPFEQSTDLIEAAIARAEADLAETCKRSEALKNGELREDGKAYHHVYRVATSRYDRGGYRWELVGLEMTSKTYDEGTPDEWTMHSFRYVAENPNTLGAGGRHCEIQNGYGDDRAKSIDEMRVKMNTRYAKAELDSRADMLRNYIKWQRERIANWKPMPLKERAD